MKYLLQMLSSILVFVVARKIIGEPFLWYEELSLGFVSGMISIAWWKYVIEAKP